MPRVMVGMLLTTLLNTVFFNMLIGQWLLNRAGAGSPWPRFSEWRLPDHIVALVIIAGVSLLLPGDTIRNLGLNLIIAAATLYFIQGLAIITSLLERWNVPAPLRALVFLLIILQAYGFVALVGLADVWVDLRRRLSRKDNDTADND